MFFMHTESDHFTHQTNINVYTNVKTFSVDRHYIHNKRSLKIWILIL